MWGGPGAWWPLMMVMPLVMVSIGVVMMLVVTRGRSGRRDGWLSSLGGHRALAEPTPELPQPREDPLAILRERWARGEIDMEEFERRLDQLVRTEPEFIGNRRPDSHD